MPIKPYEFTKSADVIAQSQAKIEEMRMSRDPAVQKMAHTQQFLDAMFKLPEIRQAQKMEGVMEGAASMEKDEGESELDFQIRQAEYIRKNAAKIDPNVSLQANERLMTLQTEKRERAKLAADEAYTEELRGREGIEWQRKANAYRNKHTHVIVSTDADGNTQLVEQGAFDDTGEGLLDSMNRRDQLAAENPTLSYQVIPLSDVLEETADENGNMKLATKFQNKAYEKMEAANSVAIGITNLTETLSENDLFALSPGSSIQADAAAMASKAEAEVNGYYSDRKDDNDNFIGPETIKSWKEQDQRRIEGRFENALKNRAEISNISAAAQAQVKELAYKLAKTLDPSGRLSDQDVDMAIEMIVGNGDPAALEKLLKKRLETVTKELTVYRQAARDGNIYGKYGRQQEALLDQNLGMALGAVTKLSETIQAYKQGPAARGEVENAGGTDAAFDEEMKGKWGL